MANSPTPDPGTLATVKQLLINILGLDESAFLQNGDTPLLGNFPEFDSMAVVSVLTALEEQFGIGIEDDDINGGTFETLGSLAAFVQARQSAYR